MLHPPLPTPCSVWWAREQHNPNECSVSFVCMMCAWSFRMASAAVADAGKTTYQATFDTQPVRYDDDDAHAACTQNLAIVIAHRGVCAALLGFVGGAGCTSRAPLSATSGALLHVCTHVCSLLNCCCAHFRYCFLSPQQRRR